MGNQPISKDSGSLKIAALQADAQQTHVKVGDLLHKRLSELDKIPLWSIGKKGKVSASVSVGGE